MKPTITIIGAGLVGALLATLLAQRGFAVHVFERRLDPRKTGFIGGRSINLALAERGRHALRAAGLQDVITPLTVAMRGRMVHPLNGTAEFLQYGRDDSEVIWSISRGDLNLALIEAATRSGARIHFDRYLERVEWALSDAEASTLHFRSDAEDVAFSHSAQCLIGADGAGSALRHAMSLRSDLGERFEQLDHSYKELEIPAGDASGPTASTIFTARDSAARFALQPHALHIWPRGTYMCIALPNAEGSFTVTLFMPNTGTPSFASVCDAPSAQTFFAAEFPDLLALIPDLCADFAAHPLGTLGTLYLRDWHVGGNALLIGDAAHAIVPFHGQGMNCGFEDALALAEALTADAAEWPIRAQTFARFQNARKPNADAIAAMALDNYVEMRDRVDDADFLLMRALERTLATRHPQRFVPRYWMVTFSRLPYSIAYERGKIQSEILRTLTSGKTVVQEVDLDAADALIKARLPPL